MSLPSLVLMRCRLALLERRDPRHIDSRLPILGNGYVGDPACGRERKEAGLQVASRWSAWIVNAKWRQWWGVLGEFPAGRSGDATAPHLGAQFS